MLPPVPQLMQSLDRLPHGGRVGSVCKLAYQHREEASLDGWLETLFQAAPRLALDAARHAQRLPFLVKALLDPRPRVACHAFSLLLKRRRPADLARILEEGCAAVRRRLLYLLSVQGDPDQVASLLPQVEERHGAREAARLLPALKPERLKQELPRLHPHVPNWRRLALRRPQLVLDWLEETLRELPARARPGLWQQIPSAIPVLAEKEPARLLQIALDLCAEDELAPLPLGTLALRCPDQVLALVTRPAWARAHSLPPGLLRHVERLGLERVRKLVPNDPGRLAQLLDHCPPSWRQSLFETAYANQDLSQRVWPVGLLEVLPHSLRCREAERMLGLRVVDSDPAQRLEVASYAGTETANRVLVPACQAALAEDRARAVRLWLQSTGRNRAGLTETLTILVPRLKNEQDPVRLAACQALAAIPPTLFTADTLPPLNTLVDAVVQARDSSWSTRNSLEQVGRALLRRGALDPDGPFLTFSLKLQSKLVGQSGNLTWPVLRDLPRGTENHLLHALLDYVTSSNQRDSYGLLLSLARALGKRAWKLDELQELLEEATAAKPDGIAMSAISLWLEDPATRQRRCRKLLDRDLTVIACQEVFETVHERRQDWLDPFLEGKVIKGRFLSQKTIYLLPATGGFWRWLPRQQQAFARLQHQVAQDAKRPEYSRAQAIKTLCQLTTTVLADLKPYLSDPAVAVQEAALGACVRLEPPSQSLETLLENLDGDRARVAMYAVPVVANWTAPEPLAKVLRDLLARPRLKVTVHKEALRLVGAYRVTGAAEILTSQWQKPEQHRDVRIAVLHAARAIWEWPLLEEASRAEDPYVARSLCDQAPGLLTGPQRQRYTPLLLALTTHADQRVRQDSFECLSRWGHGQETTVARALEAGVSNLELGPEWKTACASLVQVCRDGAACEVVVDTAKQLVSLPESADLQRDRPAFQRLLGLIANLEALPWARRQALRPLLNDCAAILPDPLGARVRLAALEQTLPASAFPQELLGYLNRQLQDPSFDWEAAEAWFADWALASPRAAVLLARLCGQKRGWTPEWRERLQQLREHADPQVRWEAGLIFAVSE